MTTKGQEIGHYRVSKTLAFKKKSAQPFLSRVINNRSGLVNTHH